MSSQEEFQIKAPEDEEIFASNNSDKSGKEEVYFNEYLEIIESIVLSDEFCDEQEEFFLKNCDKFTTESNPETGEFSHDCITVFQQYCLWVERVIEAEVLRRRVSLNIAQFISLLQGQISQLQGEVFDTLYSMADFSHFQNTMQQYRRLKALQPTGGRSRSPKPPRSGPPKTRSASSSSVPYQKLNECLTVTGVPNPEPGTFSGVPNSNPESGSSSDFEANGSLNSSNPATGQRSHYAQFETKCEKLVRSGAEILARNGAKYCRMLKGSQSFDHGAFKYQNGFRDRSLDEIHNRFSRELDFEETPSTPK